MRKQYLKAGKGSNQITSLIFQGEGEPSIIHFEKLYWENLMLPTVTLYNTRVPSQSHTHTLKIVEDFPTRLDKLEFSDIME